MPSSTTPGNPIIDSSRTTMSAWPSPRVDRLGTPKAPAIRFTRAMTFGATWFTHLLRPARLLAPQYGSDHLRGQRGLLLPGFQRVRPVAGYDCSSDWTLLLAGLSPARMTASLAAPTPSVGTSIPVTGLVAGQTLVGIDVRPTNGLLYGLGVNAATDTATLYNISVLTGVATIVGSPVLGLDLPASGYGFDFNPL